MGVDLGQLVPHKETELKELAGKTIAIDAYNTLYQFVSIIRQPDGTPLKDSRGRITSHLAGLLYRTANLVEARIRPVFVFDGPPHPLKRETLVERGARKEKAEKEYKEALAEGDIERARTKATQTSRLTPEMVDQAKALVSALGLTYVDAPGEGEAQAVRLVELGRADVVGSQDYDALLFGAPRLVRNLTVTGRRKLPRKQVWVDVIPEAIRLDAVEEETGLKRPQLIDVALFLGTDFNKGVKGVGVKKALKLIQDHGSLEGVQKALKNGDIAKDSALHKQLTEGWEGLEPIDEIRSIFLEPDVTDAPERVAGELDPDRVRDILVDQHGFARGRVDSALDRYLSVKEAQKQKSLDAFFS